MLWGGEFGRTPTNEGTGTGRDHEKLTYHYSGRDFWLTFVYGKVCREMIA